MEYIHDMYTNLREVKLSFIVEHARLERILTTHTSLFIFFFLLQRGASIDSTPPWLTLQRLARRFCSSSFNCLHLSSIFVILSCIRSATETETETDSQIATKTTTAIEGEPIIFGHIEYFESIFICPRIAGHIFRNRAIARANVITIKLITIQMNSVRIKMLNYYVLQ